MFFFLLNHLYKKKYQYSIVSLNRNLKYLSKTFNLGSIAIIKTYAKNFDELEIKALVVEGQLLDGSQIDILAKLPSKEDPGVP